MALKYDYDICRPVQDGEAQPRALFRDPATVEALRAAEPGLRAYFEACGFGLAPYDSGAPDDCFPAADLGARNDITERLSENLAAYSFEDEGAFSFAEFLDYEFRARPVEMVENEGAGKTRARRKLSPKAFGALIARLKSGSARRVPTVNPLVLGVAVLTLFLVPFISQAMGRF